MKSLLKGVGLCLLALCAGCATQGATITSLSDTQLAKFTHSDLKSAAKYARDNGFPARAAVYDAIEAQLTACEKALDASRPAGSAPETLGAFTAFEIGAEGVAQGVPASVKLNCSVVQLPTGVLGILK